MLNTSRWRTLSLLITKISNLAKLLAKIFMTTLLLPWAHDCRSVPPVCQLSPVILRLQKKKLSLNVSSFHNPLFFFFFIGFFGPVPGSLLSQVGRGYTDLCAALLAVGLEASELQIWKEVDGIFTADPLKVSTARLISVISPDEAAELTYYGSEVVHPFTMEQVMSFLIFFLF